MKVLTLLAAGLLATTAAASPAVVSAPNGVVGVQESVSISAPAMRSQGITVTLSTPGVAAQQGSVVTDSNGNATLPWTPSAPGVWTVTAAGTTSMLAVNAVPTSTMLAATNTLTPNQAAYYSATVTSLAGTIAPSGTVKLVDGFGNVYATAALVPGTTNTSSNATLTWTPTATPSPLRAVFTPATAAFGASFSGYQAPILGPSSTVVLRLPENMYVGVPAILQGVVATGTGGGTLAFNEQIDGINYYIGGSRSVVNSVGSQLWAPTQLGYQTIGVQFATFDLAVNGNSSQAVFVKPAPTPDAVTLTANGGALPATMMVGNTATLAATATSTNPVTLSATGSCVISGATLRALAAGPCTVTAAAMGNGGNLSASTKSYVSTVSAPPAPAKKPAKNPARR